MGKLNFVVEGLETEIDFEKGGKYLTACVKALESRGRTDFDRDKWVLSDLAGNKISFDNLVSVDDERNLFFINRGEKLELEEWITQLSFLYSKKEEFEQERPRVILMLERLRILVSGKYRIVCPYRVGGTGVVLKAEHLTVPQHLVIKFNRPLRSVYKNAVENERRILSQVNHENIIHIIDMGHEDGENPLSFIVEPFIAKAQTLDKFVASKLAEFATAATQPSPTEARDERSLVPFEAKEIDRILLTLTGLLFQWAKSILYIHDSGLLYLDIKPMNAVVDESGHLYVIDFGSAKKRPAEDFMTTAKESNPQNSGYFDILETSGVENVAGFHDSRTTNVVYTLRYAHPDLQVNYVKTESDRVYTPLQRSKLTRFFDYYALGRSILELLNTIATASPNTSPQRPMFRYLHFLGTRLLDGKNRGSQTKEAAGEIFGDLVGNDYRSLRYIDMKDVVQDLEKELGYWSLEKAVPELESYPQRTIRVVSSMNTPLTPRILSIIEHPLFARLKAVTQLGLVSLLYPTADHSRYDHSLGTFTFATGYIKSLFNDPQNPLFRNLISTVDIQAALLAALLHDLGQYPLAHDLEEVHSQIFNHNRITRMLLDDKTRDNQERTLQDIIEDGIDGWGVDITYLKDILKARASASLDAGSALQDFRVDMLSALIDGHIDADKADYILRDSAQCRLTYGDQLDIDRLLRVLTVAVLEESPTGHRAAIGVYEKGKPSAEAFGNARNSLFSSVYWHHTSRISKAMLQYSVALGLGPKLLGVERGDSVDRFRDQLIAFITSLAPPFDKALQSTRGRVASVQKVDVVKAPAGIVGATLESAGDAADSELGWYAGLSWTDWLMMDWLRANLPEHNAKSIALLSAISKRSLYKRVVTFTVSEHKDIFGEQWPLSWSSRVALCEEMQNRIEIEITKKWGSLHSVYLKDVSEVKSICSANLAILVDIPNPEHKSGYQPARPVMIVPELRQKTYYQETDKPYPLNSASYDLTSISQTRILCHPALRQAIGQTYREPSIRQQMARIVRESWEALNA